MYMQMNEQRLCWPHRRDSRSLQFVRCVWHWHIGTLALSEVLLLVLQC